MLEKTIALHNKHQKKHECQKGFPRSFKSVMHRRNDFLRVDVHTTPVVWMPVAFCSFRLRALVPNMFLRKTEHDLHRT